MTPILVLLFLGAGVFVARGRRRALVGAGLGLAASMLILAIGLEIARGIYLNSVPSSTLPSDAAASVFDAFVHFIKVGLRVVLVLGLVVAIAAFFTGPSHTAVGTRSGSSRGWTGSGITASAGAYPPARRPVDVPAPQEPSCRGGGPIRPDIRLLGEPTALVVIVLVILLLVVLALIELIGRPPASAADCSSTMKANQLRRPPFAARR